MELIYQPKIRANKSSSDKSEVISNDY